MAKYYLDGRVFKSQTAAKEYTRSILKPLIGSSILEHEEGWDFFNELISRHPEYEEKRGCGVYAFVVATSAYGHVELNLKRKDGSETDISWVTCVKAKAASVLDNLKAAMRLAIDDQILAFKESFKAGTPCAECSDPIKDKYHADHFIHFEKLFQRFLELFPDHPEKFDDEPVTNRAKFKAKDLEFEKAWQDYHKKEAVLRFTHPECNLKRSKT